MAAPKGNKFWEQRSRHGRELIFSSPTILWEAACEYFEHTNDRRDWNKQDWVGKDGDAVVVNVRVPFTLSGLYVFLDIDRKTWDLYRHREDFIPICTRIEQVIYTQKFEGAATGHYNANIIARDLGLRDKADIDHTTGGEKMQGVSKEDIERIAKSIRANADGNRK